MFVNRVRPHRDRQTLVANGGQNIFIFTSVFPPPVGSHLPAFCEFFAAESRRLTWPELLFNNDDVAREERARAAQVHQHTVMTRNRDNLHFGDYRRRKLVLANCVAIQRLVTLTKTGRLRSKSPAGDQVLHRACIITRAAAAFIRVMRFSHLFPSQLAQSTAHRNGNFAVLISSGFLVRRQSPLLPDQCVSIAGRFCTAPPRRHG